MSQIVSKLAQHLVLPGNKMFHQYSHPGIGNAIEIPQGHYALSTMDKSKEYLHTQSLCSCIGLGIRNAYGLTMLAHVDALNDVDKLFDEVRPALYKDNSSVSVGIAGGMKGQSETILERIYFNLIKSGKFEIDHFEVLDSSGPFDQRDMHVSVLRGYYNSGHPGFFSAYVEPTRDTVAPIPRLDKE